MEVRFVSHPKIFFNHFWNLIGWTDKYIETNFHYFKLPKSLICIPPHIITSHQGLPYYLLEVLRGQKIKLIHAVFDSEHSKASRYTALRSMDLGDTRFLIGSQNTWDTRFWAKSLEDARFFRDTRFLAKSLEDAQFLVLMF